MTAKFDYSDVKMKLDGKEICFLAKLFPDDAVIFGRNEKLQRGVSVVDTAGGRSTRTVNFVISKVIVFERVQVTVKSW